MRRSVRGICRQRGLGVRVIDKAEEWLLDEDMCCRGKSHCRRQSCCEESSCCKRGICSNGQDTIRTGRGAANDNTGARGVDLPSKSCRQAMRCSAKPS